MGVNVITQQPQATVIAINSTHETEINGGGGGGEIPSIVSAKSDVEAPLLGQTHPAARRNSDGDGRVGGRRNTVEPEEGERTCRICFDGVSEGRLISPCKCKGTSKYVHTKCLHQWRTTSQKQESYYECDTCKYKYELSRAKFEAVLTNKYVIIFISSMVFAALVIVCGFPFKAIQLAFTPPYQQPDPFWQFSWPTFNQISWQHCFGGLIFQGAVGFILLIFYQIIMSCIVREIHPSLRLSTTCICTDNCAGCAAVSGEFMFFFLIAAVIAVGLYATVATTYTLLKTTTTYILTSIEDSVLEVKE